MSTSSVSTASSFNTQLMQQTFDYAIEDTCRHFGLLSPFKNETSSVLYDEKQSSVDERCMNSTECDGMTFDGFIHQERLKKFPQSYYHVQEMNKGPVDYAPRLASIPSQYQLESLTEMYLCDYPKLYPSVKRCDANIDVGGVTTALNSQSNNVPLVMDEDGIQENAVQIPEIYSQYISEMLY